MLRKAKGTIGPDSPDSDVVVWDDDDRDRDNYEKLGKALAMQYFEEMFRAAGPNQGLVMATPTGDLIPIKKGSELFPLIVDRIDLLVSRGGQPINQVPMTHLNAMLKSEVFLGQFDALDFVALAPVYVSGFRLTKPGYNAGRTGDRVLYLGDEPQHCGDTVCMNRFLDQMDFETEADRTNAVAGALTVLLRNHWPGAKPILLYTATKCHSGKETCVDFCRNSTNLVSISYQPTDWALERSFVNGIVSQPDVGMISIDNARLGRGTQLISSAFVERFVTDAYPFLHASNSGAPRRVRNNYVVAITTNFGSVSDDILNRSLAVNLAPKGDVNKRASDIGNPRYGFLPSHVNAIAAELRGMIERWKSLGMPKNEHVQHSFTDWAQTIGGILTSSGFGGFLENHEHRGEKNPVRRALGFLGSTSPDAWLPATAWAGIMAKLELTKVLVPDSDQGGELGRQRGIGIVLTHHQDETFRVETDDEIVFLKLEKSRRRFGVGEQPSTRYQFAVVERTEIPAEVDHDVEETSVVSEPTTPTTPDTLIRKRET